MPRRFGCTGSRNQDQRHCLGFSFDDGLGSGFHAGRSDGGAIGGFHVRVFLVDGDTVKDATGAIEPAVNAFKSRHFCKTRGNNVTALKWLDDSRLMLMTEAYPTGDCGQDLGHAEAYIVAIPSGKIERHLTREQLKRFPGICLGGSLP